MEYENKDGRWVWVSFAPEHRLILAIYVGPRTRESADAVVEQTSERIDEDVLPLFVSDGLKLYIKALLKKYHFTKEFPRTSKRGRPRKPIQIPLLDLKYAQVVKKRKKGRVVAVEKRIVFGKKEDIPESEICTSYIERLNFTLRQENNRLTRKTLGFSKEDAWLDYQAIFYMTYYNFVRTHDALKIPMETRIHEKVWRKYQKRTPMMSIGITEHVWSMDELLRFPYHKISTN